MATLQDPHFVPIGDDLYKAIFLLQQYVNERDADEDPVQDCNTQFSECLSTVLFHIEKDALLCKEPYQMARLYINADRANWYCDGMDAWGGFEKGFLLIEDDHFDLEFSAWMDVTLKFPPELFGFPPSQVAEIVEELRHHPISRKRMEQLTFQQKETALPLVESLWTGAEEHPVACLRSLQDARLHLVYARLKSCFHVSTPRKADELVLLPSNLYEEVFQSLQTAGFDLGIRTWLRLLKVMF